MVNPDITRKFNHPRFYRDVMMIMLRRQDNWETLKDKNILTYEQRKLFEMDYELDMVTIVSLAYHYNLDTSQYTTYMVDGHELPLNYKILKDTTQSERSWPTKNPGEGFYYADCTYCLRTFTGEKGHVTCRFCETNKIFKQG